MRSSCLAGSVLLLCAPQHAMALRERIAQIDALAAAQGRKPNCTLEADTVVRHDDKLVWAELLRQWQAAAGKTVPISGAAPATGGFDELCAGPNL